jgi:hypothetical protein
VLHGGAYITQRRRCAALQYPKAAKYNPKAAKYTGSIQTVR